MYWFDWTYFIFIVPCIIISAICSANVNTTFSRYSKIQNSRRMTGAQAAQQVLQSKGVIGVKIEPIAGKLTDHYDPRTNTIRLSESVYNSTSIAAVGVAAHEAGHAVQHAEDYFPNKIRSAMVPITNFSSRVSWLLIVLGLCFIRTTDIFITIGIILFGVSVVFTLITLPVEFNASRRALECIKSTNMLNETEYPGAKKVLTAAAMTYVAAALTALLQLARLIFIARNRR